MAAHKDFCNNEPMINCSELDCDTCEVVFNAATGLVVKNLTASNKQSTPCPVCKRKMVPKLVCTNKKCSCIYKN